MKKNVSDEIDSPSRAVVQVRELRKSFRRGDGTHVTAIDATTLDVADGEFVVLLGPSGCGKTTLLRCVAGLEQPDGGEIQIAGQTVYSAAKRVNVSPEHRALSMIFQSYALWPHMSVFRNVSYPLENRRPRISRAEIKSRVAEVLELVGIPELAKQYPTQLSGGQQQRVALARALVGGSRLVLFDEPLSNVDAKVREQLRHELSRMQRELAFSALYVTHDQAEAMQLGDRIAVIGHGALRQLGSPREIYDEPASRYVANFIGTTNELVGRVTAVDRDNVVAITAVGPVRGTAPHQLGIGDPVVALWRPERTTVSAEEPSSDGNWWQSTLESEIYVGTHAEQILRAGSAAMKRLVVHDDGYRPGDRLWVGAAARDVRMLAIAEDDTVPAPPDAGEIESGESADAAELPRVAGLSVGS